MLKIVHQICNLCGLCQKSCPFGAISTGPDKVAVDERCTLCGACVSVCPQSALSIERRQASPEELARSVGVFVWAECEVKEGRLVPRRVVHELLTHGRRLAERLGQPLLAVVLGDDRLAGLERLCHQGADRVICCRHELLGRYSTDGFTTALAAVVAKEKPSVLLFGATPTGRDLALRVCACLTADSTGSPSTHRPACSFPAATSWRASSPHTWPQCATVRPNVFSAAEPDERRPVTLQDFPVNLSRAAIRTKVVEELPAAEFGEKIEEARILVSAGRGCGDPSNLDLVRRLAHRLGGGMAGSRAIVELGWIPHTLQVGQSGTTVGPDLYVAVGISGAVQHIVGMSSSKKIIAINKDPDAPIFKIADIGVVGDAQAILPKLLDQLKSQ
jgi:electron transfer flavoprotein alpha subunit